MALTNLALLAAWLSVFTTITAVPELAFPINSQVPPVAYVAQPYHFQFSATTFTSKAAGISYSINNQPSWIHLDEQSRSLYGTPGIKDVGSAKFELIASDKGGQNTISITLVVVERSSLELGIPILSQLAVIGPVSTPCTLILKPLASFSIQLSTEIFIGTTAHTKFYAISTDRSPLPSWIQFDPERLSFSGLSTSLVSKSASEQNFGILLIASNVDGFAEAIVPFQIAVSFNILAFATPTIRFNVTRGQKFASHSLRELLTLNGRIIQDQELVSVHTDAPGWMTFDRSKFTLEIEAGDNFNDTVVTVTALDIYSDTANMTITLSSDNGARIDNFGISDAVATAGQFFSYTLNWTDSQHTTFAITTNLTDSTAWLKYSDRNLTFYGYVPPGLETQDIYVAIAVSNGTNRYVKSFVIHVMRSSSIKPSHPRPSESSSMLPSGTQAELSNLSSNSRPNGVSKEVILAVVLSITLAAFVIVVLACLLLWRRKRSIINEADSMGNDTTSEHDPIDNHNKPPPNFACEQQKKLPNHEAEARESSSNSNPKLRLSWLDSSAYGSQTELGQQSSANRVASVRSSWGDLILRATDPARFDVRPEEACTSNLRSENVKSERHKNTLRNTRVELKPLRQPDQPTSIEHRSSRPLSNFTVETIVPQIQLHGAGHGSANADNLSTALQRSSWQTTLGSFPLFGTRSNATDLGSIPIQSWRDRSPAEVTHASKVSDPLGAAVDDNVSRDQFLSDLNHFKGEARFSNASSFYPHSSLRSSKLPHEYNMSPALNDPRNSFIHHNPWSGWSEIGPAARHELGLKPSTRRAPTLASPFVTRRNKSEFSSRQFDSAPSSTSHSNSSGPLEGQFYNDEARQYERTHGSSASKNTSSILISPPRRKPTKRDAFRVWDDYADNIGRKGEGEGKGTNTVISQKSNPSSVRFL